MTENNILTPQQVSMANEAEPHEVLLAIHKRVVDTEKLMIQYRNHAQNLDVEIGMLKERIGKLEDLVSIFHVGTQEDRVAARDALVAAQKKTHYTD